ncbi:DUF4238 domain-containing protein [Pseudomonas baetica]|uniref:DUF4238 domain-containing protein n=1 Tax=Pseudomonas baetica TaxID=674054 RepID=UPI002404A75D|nr:DUF4238 domain-containing protein [Pseudomonas baetica]MDF9775381.1 hypothetical protein [Pseudomonas baetica]
MQKQVTRENHYVPQWYQRGFLAKGRHKLHVRNLRPATTTLPNGQLLQEQEVEELGPKLAFKEFDLYTTRFGEMLNDDIETYLFGKIDKKGADAVRGWISGDPVRIHRTFLEFFGYMDAQRLRTPKGLDWILKHYQGLPQTELMVQMQLLRQMHCAMWSECVREIVSAANSSVKFLVSDHPITLFNPKLSSGADECQYPDDPGIQMMGTQTIFVLDANHCLILTNLEYAENPDATDHLARRTNARFRGESIARTDAMLRGRELSEGEVNAINLVLLSRAKQFVAGGQPEWLHPERSCRLSWDEIGKILLPGDELRNFGGEIYVGFEDGTSKYSDQFGRTSNAHEFLAKPHLKSEPELDDRCGCGSGLPFRDCCADIATRLRPSWRVMSIRERNLALISGISKILELDGSADSWLRVRRTLTDEQVQRIHKLHAALWPSDTQMIDLLPSPQSKRSRALYLGMTDARTLSAKITGMLAYMDELVVAHPFINANAVRKEFSPLHQPASYRAQTLQNIFALLVLEPAIREGRIHLVPDPSDFDCDFRSEIMAINDRAGGEVEIGPSDKAMVRGLGREEMMRAIKRLSSNEMKNYIRRLDPTGSKGLTDAGIDSVVKTWRAEVERDPLALLTPVPQKTQHGEFKIMKGFARETGLYVATLTGAFVYTDSDTQWARLHQTDGVHRYEEDPAAKEIAAQLELKQIQVPTLTYYHESLPKDSDTIRALLREVAMALRKGATFEVGATAAEREPTNATREAEQLLTFNLRASIPAGGFQRTDVTRLLMTFGRMEDVPPVRLALFFEPTVKTI